MARNPSGDPDMFQGGTARASSRCEPLLFVERASEAGWGGSGPNTCGSSRVVLEVGYGCRRPGQAGVSHQRGWRELWHKD